MGLTKPSALAVQRAVVELRGASEAVLTAGLDLDELQRLALEGEVDVEKHRDTDGLKKNVRRYLAAHAAHEKAVAKAAKEL